MKDNNLGINCEISRKELPTILISAGSLSVVGGIFWSVYIASLNEPNTTTLWPSIILLGGTFLLGCGFYLKSNDLGEKFSGYGHFMLGLAALITLPQAPEMLKHILKIEIAIEKLRNIQEAKDGEVKYRFASTTREAKTFPELEDKINSLVRAENALPHTKSRRQVKSAFLPPKGEIPSSMIPSAPPSGVILPQGGLGFQTLTPPSIIDPNLNNATVAPAPGMAYLTKENADRIIATLKKQKFDPSLAEALVQRNLEVCHPMDRTSKCAK